MKATRKVLEAVVEYLYVRGLTDWRVKIEELFAPVEQDF